MTTLSPTLTHPGDMTIGSPPTQLLP